jgi:hypothetical protein
MPGAVGAQAVLYARSTDGGATWSAPVQAAQGQVDWPQVVVAAPGQVHLIWTRARATSSLSQGLEAWAAYSLDGGERFSEAARVRGLEQVSGPVSAATDEAGALYVVGMGQSASGESQLLYARWDGGKWSERDAFSLGQVATAGNAAFAALSPGGNRLNVLLRESVTGADGNSQFEIVATGRQVAAAPPAAPAPTFTPLPTQTPTPTATPLPTATARPIVRSGATGTPAQVQNDLLAKQTPLLLGGALAGLAILVTLGLALAWTRR